MDEENKELLKEANKVCLETALNLGLDTSEGQEAYRLAMTGYDRDIKMKEMDLKESDQNVQKEQKEKESKRNLTLRLIEIGTVVFATPILDFVFKKCFAKMICNFEKTESFTTTAGRSLSSLFRFKK